MEDQDIIREFLIESSENLSRLDNEIVDLERRPHDKDLLASIFRTFHTIKGTCGFLGFTRLERLTHEAETILSHLRSGEREVTIGSISLILDVVDATRALLGSIESSGDEGTADYEELLNRLKRTAHPEEAAAAPAIEPQPEEPQPRDQPAAEASSEPGVAAADSAIRVDVGLLDRLMTLVGELVLARNQILQHNIQNEDPTLHATSQRLNLITTELQESVMKTRMQPIGVVWNKLPRVVRDIAHSLGKQIRLEMDGAETELDKTIIEAIKDPLTHLVRNCCDHGIERPDDRLRAGKPAQGTILLRAYHEGGQVNIEITDNGKGIDLAVLKRKAVEKGVMRVEQVERLNERDALHLIFAPGFSTAAQVTNVSGRGVGMDVVKSNIEKIGGIVDVSSRIGEGTTVRLKIPLTLAIIPGLVITSGGERFVIPQVSLLELVHLEPDTRGKQIEHVHGTPVFRRRGSLLPVAYLNQVLRLPDPADAEGVNIVVLQADDRQFGLVVDAIHDTEEIVVKPLAKQLKGLATYAGATIMGDGRVALILDVAGIGQRSGVLSAAAEQARASGPSSGQVQADAQRLLLFRSGCFERLAVPLSVVARLEEFPRAMIEYAGGRRVVQYRDVILPLISLAPILQPEITESGGQPELVETIVFTEGERSVGLVVDQILDIVEETVTIRQQTSRRGLFGSAVIDQRVTDFLDLHAVLAIAGEDWFETRVRKATATVLLAEPSAFSRGLLRTGLEMSGHQVVEAGSAPEVLRLLEQRAADVVVASFDVPPAGAPALLATMRQQPGCERLPAVVLTNSPDERVAGGPDSGLDEYQAKFDWEAMAESVERLASVLESEENAPALAGRR